jgi:hypothetical protein
LFAPITCPFKVLGCVFFKGLHCLSAREMFVHSEQNFSSHIQHDKCSISSYIIFSHFGQALLPIRCRLCLFTTNTHTNREALFISCLYTVKLIGKPYLLKTRYTQNYTQDKYGSPIYVTCECLQLTHINREALFTLTNINEP